MSAHAEKAAEALASAQTIFWDTERDFQHVAAYHGMAQAHATLALVEAQERTAAALERIAGEKGILGVEKIA